MPDQTDLAILGLLQENARRQWKEIGDQVHLTGPAVAARVQAMQESGLLQGFTVRVDPAKLGRPVRAFITVFMKTHDHAAFRQFVDLDERITALHRVGGEGCYWLEATLASHGELEALLESLLTFGNYRVQISLNQLKG